MTPFARFRQHVQDQPDAVACITPYRVATYRKMWSRIERSTARLQGEWGILPGDIIAYVGCGHLDALVMYLAAARCGACVLPLEHAALQARAAVIVAEVGAVLVLHDDALPPTSDLPPGMACRPLSTLIATICRHRESVAEDSAAPSLLQWPRQSVASADPVRQIGALHRASIEQLALETVLSATAEARSFSGPMFDNAVFGPLVLATLLAGQTLSFASGVSADS